MLDALTVTQAGMLNDVQRLHSIGHNVANAGTVGFKREIAATRAFLDQLSAAAADDPAAGASRMRPVMSVHIDHSDGALKFSGNPLDVGLEGSGFLAVATPFGEAYTRQGNLRLDANGRLITAGGHAVLGTGGEIRLTRADPRIDAQGDVWEGTTFVGRLRVVDIKDRDAMTRLGEGLFLPQDGSVSMSDTTRVRQGFAEVSNVVAMNEMIKMIDTVRHFEASQRLIRGYDAMLDKAINSGGEL